MAKKPTRVTQAELEAEGAVALPAKEVISLLNLNVDLDLALDLAAPIDLAVAANANIAAPIDAAVSANVLSLDSAATAGSTQQVLIDQYVSGEAIASAPQEAIVDQSNDVVDGGTTDAAATSLVDGGAVDGVVDGVTDTTDGVTDVVDGGTINDTIDDVTGTTTGIVDGANSLLEGGLLNVDVQATLDADLAAPIAGAVAANANVAAPIDASVAANIGSIGSEAIAVANQTAVINQSLDGVVAEATAAQTAEVTQ